MNPMSQSWARKVALVTGAARGMGRAIALKLASAGTQVAVNDVDVDPCGAVAAEIRRLGGNSLSVPGNVAHIHDVDAMVEKVVREFGTIHILVNNAGILRRTRFGDLTEEEWDEVCDVNLKGTFLCSRAVLPVMKNQGSGRIVNISSSAGRSVSTLGGAHYTASKAGVLGLTRAMAKEVAPFGITVNALCPGLIDTEMVRTTTTHEELQGYIDSFPIHRLGAPDEVADTVLFLTSDEAAYITGASIDINGGDLMM
jgi:3-oxoacyl-[acyl-carrier protein] reductase